MNHKTKGLAALFGTVILWSFMVVLAKDLVKTVEPTIVLFLRMWIAGLMFLPFFLLSKPWKKRDFKNLIMISTLSFFNIGFFIWGIKYTTAPVSQIIYALIPMLIVAINKLFTKDKIPTVILIGVVIGFLGVGIIAYESITKEGTAISGTLFGNILISIGVSCWLLYILLSKKLSKQFTAIQIGSTSIIVGAILSIIPFLGYISQNPFSFQNLPQHAYLESFYLGFFGTFLTYLLYQYAIQNLSALTVSLSSYIQPLFVTILSMMFLGDVLTGQFVIGSLLVFFGIFITSSFEFHKRIKI